MKRSGGGGLLLILGIVMASVAAIGVFLMMSGQAAQPAAPAEEMLTSDVVVAATLIPERSRIAPNNLKTIKVLTKDIQPDMILLKEEVVGKLSAVRILPGETVLRSKLGESQTGFAYNKDLTKGRILMAFPATELFTLGVVNPGDRVDLLVTMPYEGITQTVLSPWTGVPVITFGTTPTPVVTGTPSAKAPTPLPTSEGVAPTSVITHTGTLLVTQLAFQNLLVVSIGDYINVPEPARAEANAQQTPAATGSGAPNSETKTSVPKEALYITLAVTPQEAILLKAFKDYYRNENLKTHVSEGKKPYEFVLRAAGDDTIYTTNPTTIFDIITLYRIVPGPRGITVNELTNRHAPQQWPNQYPIPQPPPPTAAPTPTITPTKAVTPTPVRTSQP